MISANDTHRIYCHVSENVFFNMINEAKKEKIFTDENGRVDIDGLLKTLVQTFGDGMYTIKTEKKIVNIPEEKIEIIPATESKEAMNIIDFVNNPPGVEAPKTKRKKKGVSE